MPTDPRIERLRHDAEMADLDRVARPDPDVDPIARQGYSPSLAEGPAPIVELSGFTPVTFLDAPPPPIHSPQDDHSARAVFAWPHAGRRLAVTKFCKCGPCHPMHDLTLNFDFLRATGTRTFPNFTPFTWAMERDTTSLTLRYQRQFLSDAQISSLDRNLVYQWVGVGAGDGFGPPDAWYTGANPMYSAHGIPVGIGQYFDMITGFGVGSGFGGGLMGDPTQIDVIGTYTPTHYATHKFTLTCVRGGYTLMHEMLSYSILTYIRELPVRPIPTVGAGYRMYRRGVVTSCKPLAISFPDVPDSWESVDVANESPFARDFIDDTYVSRPSGLMRTPRFDVRLDDGTDRDSAFPFPQNIVDPPGVAANADITSVGAAGQPPFGVYSLGVVWP